MQFIITPIVFAALVAAKAQFTNTDFNIEAGKPFTLTWSDAQGPVTIYLKNGPSTNLKTVTTITTGATAKQVIWTPDSSLPKDTYAFEIDDGTEPNYSAQFSLDGAAPASSASATVTSTAKTSTASTTLKSTTASASASSASTTASASASASSTSASTSKASSASKTSASAPTGTPPTTNGAGSAFAPMAMLLAAGAFAL